jgi:hypothetical protein
MIIYKANSRVGKEASRPSTMKRLSYVFFSVGGLLILLSVALGIFWPFDSGAPSPHDALLDAQLHDMTAQANRHATIEWNLWLAGVLIIGIGIFVRIWARAKARRLSD